MSKTHRVEQGEHLPGIAARYGFSDYQTLWNHPRNAALKSERKNPNVLFPGDEVFIPDNESKKVSAATNQRHTFRARRKSLELRLTMEDLYFKPIAEATWDLAVGGNPTPVRSDGQGRIKSPIPSTASLAELSLKDEESPLSDTVWVIRIGDLDPVAKPSGQKARLRNLGYLLGPIEIVDDDVFRSAVEEFQCDQGLIVDGKCGPMTQAKLERVHGC